MSFSSNLKNEIISIENENECCNHAFAYGMLLFSREFSLYDISLYTEHEGVANIYEDILIGICGVTPKVTKSDAGKFRIEVITKEDREKVLDIFGYDKKTGSLRLNWSNISDLCCKNAFLRGAFLSCGTINDPQKSYHMEFVIPYMNLFKDFKRFLDDYIADNDELKIIPKSIVRNANYIIYFKDSEAIEELLTLMGAYNSSLEIMGVKIYKDVRNNVNRRLNFETANLDKTLDAATKQIDAIKHIKETVGEKYLSEELQELAELRLQNPDMSLRELGEKLSTPISRSGVNHRLQKICKISEEI